MSLIWLALFSLLSLPDVFRIVCQKFRNSNKNKNEAKKSRLALLALMLFPLYLFLTVLWSSNPLRGFLTAGIFLCILISAVSIVSLGLQLRTVTFPCLLHYLPLKSLKSCRTVPALTSLRRIFLGSAVIISLFCWLQCFLDVLSVPRDITLLCLGCTSRTFGFPHPSGFAIEPQFMGNLLLAPTLLSFYLLFSAPRRSSSTRPLILLVVFFTTTLFLIFSRGAIYSFLLGLAILSLILIVRHKSPRPLLSAPLVVLSLVLALSSQALLAHLNQTYSISPSCALETSLSQLSLDQVHPDLCDTSVSTEIESNAISNDITNDIANDIPNDTPLHTGYIAESTDIRLNLSRQALDLALASPRTFLFGYGLGSAGTTLFSAGKTASEKEIIQNEYFSLLLETGIVGLLLLLISFISLTLLLSHSITNDTATPLLISVTLASAFSLLFFSGLPNALHLYLFPVYLLLPEHEPIID